MSRLAYFVRRLGMAVLVVLAVTIITFIMIYFLPADPARMYAGPHASVQTVKIIRHQMGLDQPLYVQYWRYLVRLIHGDMGYSYSLHTAVTGAILARFPKTLELIVSAIVVELVLGIPLGVLAAMNKNKLTDQICTVFGMLGVTAPPFWTGLILLYVFAYKLSVFPLGGADNGFASLILPAFAAGFGGVGWYLRMTRSSVIETRSADYVRTAKAKGLANWKVVTKHIVRNSLGPVLTMAGQDIPWFIGNIVVVEMVFAWPGIGRMAMDAILVDDIPLILGTVTFTAMIVVVMNILVDLGHTVLDPRIELD